MDEQQYDQVDERILAGIDEVRLEWGACTAGQLANHLRMSREVITYRCGKLRERGVVSWTPIAGSLQRVRDVKSHLFDRLMVAAVVDVATGDPADEVEAVVQTWAWGLINRLHLEVWGEGANEQVPEGPSPRPPAPAESPSSEENQLDDDDLYCRPCDRTFKNRGGLTGHQRSSAHAAAVEAASAPTIPA